MRFYTVLALFAVVACTVALRCYSGTNGTDVAKDCPMGTGACYRIDKTNTPEKGCDAIGCPSAIAKTKVSGGTYACCETDLCNGIDAIAPRSLMILVPAVVTLLIGKSLA
ncbi:hypothetical protein AAVH_12973 [Aphelenchoides avenae]|nr:hypothetical protein AAVH_12973 [Aphelenchus avenae]